MMKELVGEVRVAFFFICRVDFFLLH
jgi:hypothetical protein